MSNFIPRIEPQGGGLFLIESQSRPDEMHAADVKDRTCSCEAAKFGLDCWHLHFLDDLIRRAQVGQS